MIKTTALKPRLAEIGKIKIGGKGDLRKSKSGKEFRLPVTYSQFVITTTERDQKGNLIINSSIMKKLGDSPRELRIRLIFDEVESNLQTEFAMYVGKKKACSGDGEKCERMIKEGNQLTKKKETLNCPGTECQFFKDKKCKATARLFCMLADSTEFGGVYVFRTHSINAVMAMTGALNFLADVTKNHLQGLPLKLKMIKKTTEEHGDIDYVTVVLDGLGLVEARQHVAKELESRKLLGVDTVGTRENFVIEEDEDDIPDEFYHESQYGGLEKKETSPETINISVSDFQEPEPKTIEAPKQPEEKTTGPDFGE